MFRAVGQHGLPDVRKILIRQNMEERAILMTTRWPSTIPCIFHGNRSLKKKPSRRRGLSFRNKVPARIGSFIEVGGMLNVRLGVTTRG